MRHMSAFEGRADLGPGTRDFRFSSKAALQFVVFFARQLFAFALAFLQPLPCGATIDLVVDRRLKRDAGQDVEVAAAALAGTLWLPTTNCNLVIDLE